MTTSSHRLSIERFHACLSVVTRHPIPRASERLAVLVVPGLWEAVLLLDRLDLFHGRREPLRGEILQILRSLPTSRDFLQGLFEGGNFALQTSPFREIMTDGGSGVLHPVPRFDE